MTGKPLSLQLRTIRFLNIYKTDEAITSLGIGEALVTALSENGTPTPLAVTMLRAPVSRMDILTQDELTYLNRSSSLVQKYSQVIDRESAYEILSGKVSDANEGNADNSSRQEQGMGRRGDGETQPQRPASRTSYSRSAKTPQDEIVKVLTSATFIRGVFGILSKVMK